MCIRTSTITRKRCGCESFPPQREHVHLHLHLTRASEWRCATSQTVASANQSPIEGSAFDTDTCSQRLLQVEAFAQFLIGSYNTDMSYVDDFGSIVMRNMLSVTGFWFDLVTSIPWAYVDLSFYLVICPKPVAAAAPRHLLIWSLSCTAHRTADGMKAAQLRSPQRATRESSGLSRFSGSCA
jgi:hypothetical protein